MEGEQLIHVELLQGPILVLPSSQELKKQPKEQQEPEKQPKEQPKEPKDQQAEQQEHEIVDLSVLDKQAPLFMYTLYFYDANAKEAVNVFEQLKLGMEKNLVPYHPTAGRIRPNVETGESRLHCTGEGVLLVEASTEARISDLGDPREVHPKFEKFIYRVPPVPENPLIVCQVTHTGCGGFILGVGCRHDLFDGISALQFTADWASLSRGTSLEEIPVPFYSREPLQSKVSSLSSSEVERLFAERFEGIPLLGQTPGKEAPRYESRVFSISDEMISSLKDKALQGGHLIQCSTFDVLAAHAWITRAKATGVEPSERLLLEFTVNGRPRTVPPLPNNFLGNAFIMAHKNCLASEVLDSSFHSVVKLVQEAKSSVNDSFIKDSMSLLQGLKMRALPSFRETTIVADWTNIPFHTLDFGWGAPVFATPVAMPMLDVMFLLRDGLDKGRICLRLGLLPEIMERFEKLIYEI